MVHRRVIVQEVLILALTLSFEYVQVQDVVQLKQEVHGTLMTTRKGNNISAYLGIPYAETPLGRLRFRSPIPWRRYDNQPIIAKTDGKQCPQINHDGVAVGDEDCLYLNVYTPKTHLDGPYPVMVYFHGGGYARGSGSSKDAGPEYLMDRAIVLVTVNYRLGALGFLSTGDAAAPGNFGLKDQAVALQWVNMNIIHFGGQPDKVTIFGQDAGGVSTFLHALSPGSQDLFTQFISQSGNPLSFWAFAQNVDDYPKYARYLGDYLKCPTTTESFLLVECLRSFDAYTLVASDHIFNDNYIGKWRYSTWIPSVEPINLADSFIDELPKHILEGNGLKNCPAIVGNVLDEGLVLTADFYANSTIRDSITFRYVFDIIRTLIKRFMDENTYDGTTRLITDFYFNGINETDKESIIRIMTNFTTDYGFDIPEYLQVLSTLAAYRTYPLYLYSFNYRGTYSKSSDATGNNDNIGVSHGDDLFYLFPTKNSTLQLSDSDEKMIDIMLDLWTSFAYNGSPTSQYVSDANIWEPAIFSLEALEIGKGSDPLEIIFSSLADLKGLPRIHFWEWLIFIRDM